MRWKLDLLLWLRDQETEFPVEACLLSQTQEGQIEQIHAQSFDDPFFDSTGMIYLHGVPTGQTVNKEYYVEFFKGFQEEIQFEEASTFQIGPVAFPPVQCTGLQLHPYHRLFDQDGHQDSSSASIESRPCSLWLLVIPSAQRLSLWDNWGDERGCDEGHWHAHTRKLPWSLPEVFGTIQVHCSRKRLPRRGLEFHLCTINKSAYTKKSLETYLMILVYVFVCVCVCVCVCPHIGSSRSFKHVLSNDYDKLCLYNLFKILSCFLISVLVSDWN